MALNPGTIIKGYEIKETIGTGAMSTVYLAKRKNRSYAVKELRTDFSSSEEEKILINAFQREADLLYSMEHPGLPRLYTNFKYNGSSYLIMEYIKGKSLEDVIKDRAKPFEEEKALRLGIQICEILCYLHNLSPEPVIYRDLKPSNIIVTGEDRLRLIDFGVARRYDPRKDCDTVRLGTPGYAAPEQCRKKGQSIPQSDIYALGVVLHQLLTLYDPSVTPFKLPAIRKLNQSIPEQLEYLINKAINLTPRDRYIDTFLFRDELVDYYEEHFTKFTSPYSERLPYMKEKTGPIFFGWHSFYNKYKPWLLSVSQYARHLRNNIDIICNKIFTHFNRLNSYGKLAAIFAVTFTGLLIIWGFTGSAGHDFSSYRNGLKTVSTFTPAPSATAIRAETPEPAETLNGYLIIPGKGMADLRINKSTMYDVKELLGEPEGIPLEEQGNIKVFYYKEKLTFWFTADKYILRCIWIRNSACKTSKGISIGSNIIDVRNAYVHGLLDPKKKIYYSDDGTDYYYDAGIITSIFVSDRLPVTSMPQPSPTVDKYLMKPGPDAIFDDM